MKIAQVSPLYESVPPKRYGGTERVVSYLTEELVRQGHEVTLFASGDSITKAHLISPCQRSLPLDLNCRIQMAHYALMLEQVFKDTSRFDIIHFHINYLHFPICRRSDTPNVTTLHDPLDIPELYSLFREFGEQPMVSISEAQREPLPWLNWQGTVYHGLPRDLYTFREAPGKYLAFIGRISPEKGVDRAIAIAKQVGMKLKIAAKVNGENYSKVDWQYFQDVVKPRLKDPLVEFVGEIGDKEKDEFLGHAYALLFPVDWPEPFGLPMIEAIACGTPVIAYRRGSVPEVMEDGVTGFIVDDLETAVQAMQRVSALNRRRCREVFEQRFSASRMAQDYLAIYQKILGGKLESKLALPLQLGLKEPSATSSRVAADVIGTVPIGSDSLNIQVIECAGGEGRS